MDKFQPNKSHQTGFSLIELMIVVVIIGILSFFAVPTLKDYIVRSKVANIMTLIEPTKLSVAESLIGGTTPPVQTIENLNVIKTLTVNADNSITVIGDHEKLGIQQDPPFTLTFTPDLEQENLLVWRCNVETEAYRKYAPAECRE